MYSSYIAVFEDTILRCAREKAPEGLELISIEQPEDHRLRICRSLRGEPSTGELKRVVSVLGAIKSELSYVLGENWDISIRIYGDDYHEPHVDPILTVRRQKWVEDATE